MNNGISIVFPHAINSGNDSVLELNKSMLEKNTKGEYELLYLANMKRTDLVYEGWNILFNIAKYENVLWSNSDLIAGYGWDVPVLHLMEKYDWLSLRVVECGAIGVADTMVCKDFGRTPEAFDSNGFENFIKEESSKYPESQDGWVWYCPSIIKKSKFLALGGFNNYPPFPNPNDIDFKKRAQQAGWRFGISNHSWFYHFQRAGENLGEKPERITEFNISEGQE